jgi:hypothetical protein
MGIHRKSGRNMKKNLDLGPDLDWLWPASQSRFWDEKSKSRPCKNLDSLNLESGMTLLRQKGKKK